MTPNKSRILQVCINGKTLDVPRRDYVRAKTKQLRAFGYVGLLDKTVNEQVDAVLQKKTLGDGLTVIGGFMEDEILGQKEDAA